MLTFQEHKYDVKQGLGVHNTGTSRFKWFCFNATWKFTPLFEFTW